MKHDAGMQQHPCIFLSAWLYSCKRCINIHSIQRHRESASGIVRNYPDYPGFGKFRQGHLPEISVEKPVETVNNLPHIASNDSIAIPKIRQKSNFPDIFVISGGEMMDIFLLIPAHVRFDKPGALW